MEPRNELHDNAHSRINSICQDIQAMYDAGTPVFTKDSIRKIGEELKHFQNGDHNNGAKITLKGINGELFVNPPISERGENEHVGVSDRAITYKSIKYLTRCWSIEFFKFEKAHLPMWICAPIRQYGRGLEFKNPPTPPEEDFNIYQTIVQQWKTSQHFEKVQDVLASVEIPFAVTKIIGLGLGPLVVKSRVFERFVFQHALISIRRILNGIGISYKGLLGLDEYSILVAISPNLPIKDIVADICRPGIIIWNMTELTQYARVQVVSKEHQCALAA
ncbi:hypothetical protein GGS24DRAFT_517642 [Hypoxylon argillaceum]|nr:hypothetical protein GGS24DRAFT_517642 [Hypoxylon argillaceum]